MTEHPTSTEGAERVKKWRADNPGKAPLYQKRLRAARRTLKARHPHEYKLLLADERTRDADEKRTAGRAASRLREMFPGEYDSIWEELCRS